MNYYESYSILQHVVGVGVGVVVDVDVDVDVDVEAAVEFGLMLKVVVGGHHPIAYYCLNIMNVSVVEFVELVVITQHVFYYYVFVDYDSLKM